MQLKNSAQILLNGADDLDGVEGGDKGMDGLPPRVRFMLETIYDIKNNKQRYESPSLFLSNGLLTAMQTKDKHQTLAIKFYR